MIISLLIVSMLFVFIVCCFCDDKYLYIGKNNCNAEGEDAYLKKEITSSNYTCATSIPNINDDKTTQNNLIITILEADRYSGFENLLKNYDRIYIKKKYDTDDLTTFFVDPGIQSINSDIKSIYIDDNIKLNIENELLINIEIDEITLQGPSAHLMKKNILVENLYINVFLKYFKNICFKGIGNVKITDNNQILDRKDITLDNINLEYKGKNGLDK